MDRPLPEVVENPLHPRWRLDDQRSVLGEVEIAHRVHDVEIRGGHQCLGIDAVLPDRKYGVPGTEAALRGFLHRPDVDRGQRPQVRLYRPLEAQLVGEDAHHLVGGEPAGEVDSGQLLIPRHEVPFPAEISRDPAGSGRTSRPQRAGAVLHPNRMNFATRRTRAASGVTTAKFGSGWSRRPNRRWRTPGSPL